MSLSLDEVVSMTEEERLILIESLSDDEALALMYDWEGFWARPKQLPPKGDWSIWLVLSGRGFGKTRAGAETVGMWVDRAEKDPYFTDVLRIALVAETAGDVRQVIVEGESGILAHSPPWRTPKYQPALRRLTWSNEDGKIIAEATTFAGQEPGQLRGPQFHKAWMDEWAKYQYPEETLDNIELALRLGDDPQLMITTTPKPITPLRELMKDPGVVVTRGSSYENMANLAPRYIKRVIQKYEGTRIGRQELHAHILDDVTGALWSEALLDQTRIKKSDELPDMVRIVISIDPSMTSGNEADECGITVGGMAISEGESRKVRKGKRHAYLIEDASGVMSPGDWGQKAIELYHAYDADVIVAETNNGGDLVEANLRTIDANIPFKKVWASRGKAIRAAPVAALYEQGRIHHYGYFADLEEQLKGFNQEKYTGRGSPDRAESWIWNATHLLLHDLTSHDPDDYETYRK